MCDLILFSWWWHVLSFHCGWIVNSQDIPITTDFENKKNLLTSQNDGSPLNKMSNQLTIWLLFLCSYCISFINPFTRWPRILHRLYFLPSYTFLSFPKLDVMNVYLPRNYFLFQLFRRLYVQQNFWILFGTFDFCLKHKQYCHQAAMTIHGQEWHLLCQTCKHPK